MDNPFDTTSAQSMRENIVLRALQIDRNDMQAVEDFDDLVCNALGINTEENPPNFIFDALSFA